MEWTNVHPFSTLCYHSGMEYAFSTILGLVIGGIAVYFYIKNVREASSEEEKINELKSDLKAAQNRVIELQAKGKESFVALQKLEAKNDALQQKSDLLNKELTSYKTSEMNAKKEHDQKLADAIAMKQSFEDEKMRIRREDEARQQELEAERDRIWNEHETDVVSYLTNTCKQPQLKFTSYSNNNLPDGFHGSLKPDFMIEFLDQYVIFDAKVSKSKSLQTYINDAVKTTAKKVKGHEKIYPMIFLVVPTEAISELKTTSYYEDGFTFHVVSREALAPILACLKKIETYEFAEAWDPQERENIIDLIAHFQAHIASRNAFDYLIIEEGIKTLQRGGTLDPDMVKEAALKADKIRSLNLNNAEQKELRADPELLRAKLAELTTPKPRLSKTELENVKS